MVDADGSPIAGANVSINFRPPPGSPNMGGITWGDGVVSDSAWARLRVTSDDGTFEARGLQPGQHLVLARATGYLSGGSVTVTLTAGQQLTNFTLQMLPEASISGVVLHGRHEPLVGAEVQILRRAVVSGRTTWRASSLSRKTDDRGVFRVGGIQRENISCWCRKSAPKAGRRRIFLARWIPRLRQ